MKRINTHVFAMMALLFIVGNANAQFKTKLTLGGALYSGNVNKTDIRSEGSTAYVDSLYEFSAFYKISYGEVEGAVNKEEYKGGLNVDYRPESRFSPFAMLQALKNVPKGYELALSGLAGAKYTIVKSPDANYSLSAAALYEWEQYTPDDETGETNPDVGSIRLSIRPKFSQSLGKNMTINHQTFFKYSLFSKPEIVVPDDNNLWKIDSKTSLVNKLSKKMYLELSYNIDYDGNPPKDDIKKTDNAFIVSLLIKL